MLKKILILLLLLAIFSTLSQKVLLAENYTSKHYYTKTKDGWALSLYRYIPNNPLINEVPVILCHGFNQNSRIWDLDKKHSFAGYLAGKGYDVWAVNLRGSGDSSKPSLSSLRSITKLQIKKIPKLLFRALVNIRKINWTIDDHIHKDLPAIIEFVKSKTKSSQVTWIGHSMGGMVMYAYLETENQKNIRSFVAIGSMINIKQPPNKLLSIIAFQKPIRYASLLINTTVAYQLRNLTFGTVRLPWERLFYNRDNMDRFTVMRMFRISTDDTSPGVIAQFSDVIKNGDFMSVDKAYNYTKNLSRIKIPILLTAGSKDLVANVETATYAFQNVSSWNKTLHVFSKENGYSADYGHADLLLGKKSSEEIYPYIALWLEKRRGQWFD